MRLIPYLLYLYLIAFYRTNLIELLSIGPAQIYLTALAVILVALHKDYLTAIWFACAAGFIYDAPDPAYLGVSMIILSIIGMGVSQAKDQFNLDSLKSRFLLILAGLLVYAIPHTLIYTTSGSEEFFRLLFGVSLPGILYTALVGWLFMMIQSRRFSFAKLKSIF